MKKYDQGVGDPLGMPMNSYNMCMQDSSSLNSSQGVNVRCSMRRASRVRKGRRLRVANSERVGARSSEAEQRWWRAPCALPSVSRSRGTLTCLPRISLNRSGMLRSRRFG